MFNKFLKGGEGLLFDLIPLHPILSHPISGDSPVV